MSRQRTVAAEVAGGGDERLAEMPAPEVVDGHPSGQRGWRVRSATAPGPRGRLVLFAG